MKIRTILPFAVLAVSLNCPGDEPNPFVLKRGENPSEPAPGPAFVGILEHILVPPDLIDGWLREHGMTADATALRAEVQKWIGQGKAVLDSTTVATGVRGRPSSNERILEQVYPTGYLSNGPGVWPLPTGFETRNLGYTARLGAEEVDGGTRFLVDVDYYEMHGSTPWNLLMEKTRHPDDVFLPVIRSFRLTQASPLSGAREMDPFQDTGGLRMNRDSRPTFESGRVSLMGRFDPLPSERRAGALSRLIFARGNAESDLGKTAALPEELGVSIAAIRVSHREFSDWLQQQATHSVPREAWQFIETLRNAGKAEIVDAAYARAISSKNCVIENISEVIYPIEWQQMNRMTLLEKWEEREARNVDGKRVEGIATRSEMEIEAVPGLAGASLAASFETRNAGMTYEIRVLPDEHGFIIEHIFERVQQLGNTVFRRVEDEGNWVPDIFMPLFATDRCQTSNRLQPGEWTLISSGVEFNDAGKVDREYCLLMFVKVE